jgi:hypothetical protein
MLKRRLVTILGTALLIAAASTLVLAGVPKGKGELKIDQAPGKKGAVAFNHAKHADEYKKAGGKSISCKDCHHTLKADTPKKPSAVKACSTCHAKPGEALKDVGGKKAPAVAALKDNGKVDKKSLLFHKSCVGCHKLVDKAGEDKKISKCKNCHK